MATGTAAVELLAKSPSSTERSVATLLPLLKSSHSHGIGHLETLNKSLCRKAHRVTVALLLYRRVVKLSAVVRLRRPMHRRIAKRIISYAMIAETTIVFIDRISLCNVESDD
ncbi:hypothetical protein EVAR_95750_1 [Eumeta japonica]|uniref:Uncharacterized protein n=1 Tax=Eumeta variegata TaxID=151549 RepID=A0A4C1UM70_EUMVA|nr:hypothetical protein EVAR_95750_1 [Eumeta japonica]